jgi:hypothetical protein
MTEHWPRDVRQIKLCNGEEILTEVVGEDQFEILIRNPLKVYRERVQLGDIAREANMFTRWMGFCDNDEHFLQKKDVLAEGLVNDAVALYYNKMVVNVEQDQIEPIIHASDAAEPEVAKNPTITINEEDEPTFH